MSDQTVTEFAGEAAVAMKCWCSVRFAIPESLYRHYVRENERNRGSFGVYCPMGHECIPAGRSAADELRDQLAREKHHTEQARARADAERARRESAERVAAAQKAQVTRIRNRVSAGVCPCCNRHFTNVERHMTTQHPEWAQSRKATASLARKSWKELRSVRQSLGISVADAAIAINLSRSSLGVYEASRYGDPSARARARYVAFLTDARTNARAASPEDATNG